MYCMHFTVCGMQTFLVQNNVSPRNFATLIFSVKSTQENSKCHAEQSENFA